MGDNTHPLFSRRYANGFTPYVSRCLTTSCLRLSIQDVSACRNNLRGFSLQRELTPQAANGEINEGLDHRALVFQF